MGCKGNCECLRAFAYVYAITHLCRVGQVPNVERKAPNNSTSSAALASTYSTLPLPDPPLYLHPFSPFPPHLLFLFPLKKNPPSSCFKFFFLKKKKKKKKK